MLALVEYRQRVEQLNQLIDNAASIQQWPDLWHEKPDRALLGHFADATAWIHWIGIGTMDDPPNRDGAHRRFMSAARELERERNAGWWARSAWFSYGRRWSTRAQPALTEVIREAQSAQSTEALDEHRLL